MKTLFFLAVVAVAFCQACTNDDDRCERCMEVAQSVLEKIKEGASKDEMKEAIGYACFFAKDEEKCKAAAEKLLDEFYDKIDQITPKDICVILGVC